MYFTQSIQPFCEGRLHGIPEVYNTISSLTMFAWSIVRLQHYSNFVCWIDFFNLYNILSINCLCSALFHATLWSGFKQFDEMSMILPLWFGLNILIQLYTDSKQNYIIFSYIVAFINLSILVGNSFSHLQWLFPYLFTVEISSIIYIYHEVSKIYDDTKKEGQLGIMICSLSGIIWWTTETLCLPWMRYGHALWHIGMPVGIDFLAKYIIIARTRKHKKIVDILGYNDIV